MFQLWEHLVMAQKSELAHSLVFFLQFSTMVDKGNHFHTFFPLCQVIQMVLYMTKYIRLLYFYAIQSVLFYWKQLNVSFTHLFRHISVLLKYSLSPLLLLFKFAFHLTEWLFSKLFVHHSGSLEPPCYKWEIKRKTSLNIKSIFIYKK